MKITVIGTGLIGSQLAARLEGQGHDVTAASLSSGVDLLTGAGLDGALAGAHTVVNVTNSPTFDEQSLAFFRTTVGNLLDAGERAGVRHQVVLSIVGVDQVPELDYYRAKVLQEDLLRGGPTPYSIVRATQFFEFMEPTMSWTSDDSAVRLPATPVQPVASADVVAALADVATGSPSAASSTSRAPTGSPWTSSGASPWPPGATGAPSSPTTGPACSPPSAATCSPPGPTPVWHPPTTGTG